MPARGQNGRRAGTCLSQSWYEFAERSPLARSPGGGRINDAIGHYREAVQVDSDFTQAHYHLEIALLAKGRHNEVDEDYPEVVKPLGEFRNPDLLEASAYYWKAYDLDPEWVVARNTLRISPKDPSRLDDAITHFREANRLELGRFRHQGTLGQTLSVKRRIAEARVTVAFPRGAFLQMKK